MITVAQLVARVTADVSAFERGMGKTEGLLASTARSSVATGRSLTYGVTLPLIAVGAVATKMGMDYQATMTQISTQTGLSIARVNQLSKGVLDLAPATRYGPNVLAQGMKDIAQVMSTTNVSNAQMLNLLKVAAEGAAVGNSDLEATTGALAGTMRVYHEQIGRAVPVMGTLNAIVGAGKMSMDDLNHAISSGFLPTAKSMHISLTDVGGALATMTDESVPAQSAAMRLRTLFFLMSGESTKAQKTLALLGLSSVQLGHDIQNGGLVAALRDFKNHMDAFSTDPTLRTQLVAKIFGGSRSGGTMMQLLNNLNMVHQKIGQINKTAGDFPHAVLVTQATESFKFHQALAAIETALVRIGAIIAPIVAEAAGYIAKLADAFGQLSPWVQKAILLFVAVAAAIGPVLVVFGGLITAVTFLADPIVLLVAGVAALVAAFVAAVLWPDKLKVALEHMGLSAKTAGEVVHTLRSIFRDVEDAAMALVRVVQANWPQIKAIILGVIDIVRTVISDFVSWGKAIWSNFHGEIVNEAKVAWEFIKNTIHNGLEVIRGIVDLVSGLIHGDWAKMWQGIKEIVGGTLSQIGNELQASVATLGNAAAAIGHAISKWILQPLGQLAQDLLNDVEHAVEWLVSEITSWIPHEVASIGKGIADGIIHGASGIGGGLLSALTGGISGAIGGLAGHLGIHSPSTVFADKIGRPIADGIIYGYLEGINPLPSKMAASVRLALETAKKEVESYRSKFADAFSLLTKDINQALGGSVKTGSTEAGRQLAALLAANAPTQISGPIQDANTAAGKQLAALQAAHDAAARQKALTDAQAGLSSAQAQLYSDQSKGAGASTLAADQAAILQAQQALADAQYNIQVAALEAQADLQAQASNLQAAALKKRAAEEAKHATAVREMRKHNADEALKELEKQLARAGTTHEEAQRKIVRLLERYGLTYKDVARDMGKKFADGLESSIHLTSKAAEELAKEIAKYLPHSPAEKGPLSKMPGWESYLLSGLTPVAAQVNSVFDGIRVPVGGGVSGTAWVSGRGSGNIFVEVNNPTFLSGDDKAARELARELAPELNRLIVVTR